MRVSRSGGWMSMVSPDSKRLTSRSSSACRSLGGRSLEMTICLPGVVERVERVEELLLGLLLVLQELDVVDQQHVVRAVAALEVLHLVLAHRVDEVVREHLDGHEPHLEFRGVAAGRSGRSPGGDGSCPGPRRRRRRAGCTPCPGDSATASAAAWAKRFDGPMTKLSNVYFSFRPMPMAGGAGLPSPGTDHRRTRRLAPAAAAGGALASIGVRSASAAAAALAAVAGASRRPGRAAAGSPRPSPPFSARRGIDHQTAQHGVAQHFGQRVLDQRLKAGLDPVLGEVRAHPDDEGAVDEPQAHGLGEPDAKRALVHARRDEGEGLVPDGFPAVRLHVGL